MKLWFCQDMNRKMSRGQSGSYAESGSGRSSRVSTWWERRQKRCEDREYEEGQSGLGEWSFQMYRIMSRDLGCNRFNRRDKELEQRDEELEHLCRLVRDLELQVRGRCQRMDHEEQGEESSSMEGHRGAGSYQSESHWHWDRL